jgi:hypothetical protein
MGFNSGFKGLILNVLNGDLCLSITVNLAELAYLFTYSMEQSPS